MSKVIKISSALMMFVGIVVSMAKMDDGQAGPWFALVLVGFFGFVIGRFCEA